MDMGDMDLLVERRQQQHRDMSKDSFLQLYSDGGFRSRSCASMGWVLYAIAPCSTELVWTQVSYASRSVTGVENSLWAEALVLEDGLTYVSKYLSNILAD
eukprot:11127264-Karenia_brevis.AAC.1